jgi:phosphoglycerate dehydrogenase-like enzyme
VLPRFGRNFSSLTADNLLTVKLLIALYHRFAQWTAPDWFSERLRKQFPQIQIVQLPTYERVGDELRDAELAIAWSLRGEQIAEAKKLRWIHSTAAAVHALMSPQLLASDIIVTNAREVHGPVVAEHAMAIVFALAKRLPQAVKYQERKQWAQSQITGTEPRPRELRGATITVVGLGSIGRSVALLAKSMGMRVVGVRENPTRGRESADVVHGFDDLDQALAEADFVVLAVPVTEKTHHLFDAERLSLLKRDAYLINVGRGVLIDEDAMVEALKANRFAGAGLDVTTQEPLPEDSPLWTLENVLLTPHTGGFAQQMWERHYAQYSDNLRRYLAGEPLLWVVDKHRGY